MMTLGHFHSEHQHQGKAGGSFHLRWLRWLRWYTTKENFFLITAQLK